MKTLKVTAVLIILTLSSCATLQAPKRHLISFTSTPTNAKIYLDSKKIGTTPAKIKIKPTKKPYDIAFKKEGHEAIHTQLTTHIDITWGIINIATPYLIGIGVDWITGNWRRFDTNKIHLTLTPLSNTVIDSIPLLTIDSLPKNNSFEQINELRINTFLYGTLSPEIKNFYSIDYQRILNETEAIGFSLGGSFQFNSTDKAFNSDFFPIPGIADIVLLPYYRKYYYTNKSATGIFTELSGFLSYEEHHYFYENVYKGKHRHLAIGGGIAVGYKYVTTKNWVFELLLGAGINGYSLLHTRTGVLVGKRF